MYCNLVQEFAIRLTASKLGGYNAMWNPELSLSISQEELEEFFGEERQSEFFDDENIDASIKNSISFLLKLNSVFMGIDTITDVVSDFDVVDLDLVEKAISFMENIIRAIILLEYDISYDGPNNDVLFMFLCNKLDMTTDEMKNIFSLVDDMIKLIVLHPNYFLTSIFNFIKSYEVVDGSWPVVLYPHTPEISLAWLISGDEKMLTEQLKFKKAIINCPVDVKVYNLAGDLVASIVNNEVEVLPGTVLDCYIDDNGQKCIVMPGNEEYSIQLTATDDGSVSCSFEEYSGNESQISRIVNYYDIPVHSGDVISGTAESIENNDDYSYPLVLNEKDAIECSEEITDIQYNSVRTFSNIGEAVCRGGGSFHNGEFVQVEAYETDCYEFLGWYNGNVLVSDEAVYRFNVLTDTELCALFIEHHIYPEEDNRIVEPSCTDSGCLYQTCSQCGKIIKTDIEAIGHQFSEEWKTLVDATCSVEGKKYIECEKCGCRDYKSIPMLAHTFGEPFDIMPTCTEEGYTCRICSVCEYIERSNLTAADGHIDRGDGICSVCGEDIFSCTCNHWCHKRGIFGALWRIMAFFF